MNLVFKIVFCHDLKNNQINSCIFVSLKSTRNSNGDNIGIKRKTII